MIKGWAARGSKKVGGKANRVGIERPISHSEEHVCPWWIGGRGKELTE